MKYTYTAILTPLTDGSGFSCSVPDLPGCVSSGCDLSDSISNISDAAAEWLIVAEDENLDIKKPTPQNELNIPKDSICSIIFIDTIKQRSMDDAHAIRRNVSIPAWMDRMAKEQHINLSQLLQESLRSKLA